MVFWKAAAMSSACIVYPNGASTKESRRRLSDPESPSSVHCAVHCQDSSPLRAISTQRSTPRRRRLSNNTKPPWLRYLASMFLVRLPSSGVLTHDCRHFEASPSHDRFCPFGRDCFYQHRDADGTPYVFPHGVDHYMRVSSPSPCSLSILTMHPIS